GDGVATTTLTARVTDADSNPVPGAPVVIETRDQYVTNPISPVTDHGDGTYSATVTSTVAVGIAPLQARVEGTSLVAAVDLDQVAVPPLTVQLHLVSDEVVADGADM